MRNHWWKLVLLAGLFCFLMIFPRTSRAFDPYIVHSIPRASSGWGGGITWYDGYIYEVHSSSRSIYKKSPITGAVVETIATSGFPAGLQDIAYDGKRNCFWIKGCGYYYCKVALTGGAILQTIYPPAGFGFGVFWGPEDPDSLWTTDQVGGTIYKVSALNGALETTIPAGGNPVSGIARVEDKLWCGLAKEPGYAGWIIEYDMSGNQTNAFQLPSVGYYNDVGGCTLDDDGYLWVQGGKETAIYQINIGYDPVPTFIETDIIDSGDYNGDGKSDVAIFREANGLWAVRDITRFYFGASGDDPVPGDYDNDGITDAGIFRGSNGLWVIRNITRAYYGAAGYIPVPGDYNGDGKCDPGLFRSSNGLWAVKDLTRVYWGAQSDLPVPGYYSHSRQKYIGIFRPSNGLWAIRDLTRTYFGGEANDVPLPSVAGGIGGWEPAIFRPSTGLWAVKSGFRAYVGNEADKPAPGDYDGYGGNEPAIFREVSGLWVAREATRCYFGRSGDVPVSGRVCNPSTAQMSFSY